MTNVSGTTTYGYDAADRLTSVLAPAGSSIPNETFEYGATGNPTNDGQQYDVANRLLSDATFDYTYDQEGNLIRKVERATGKTTTYTWDALYQMTSAKLPDGTLVSYKYDAFGRRVEQSSSAGTTRYVNVGANVVAEYDATNTIRASYVTAPGTGDLPGTLLEVRVSSTSSYPLLDPAGSVTGTTDSAGALTSKFSYSAYGQPVGASSGTYAFGTYGYDTATGLHYARARYYDPSVGQFLSEDPRPSTNAYRYVGDTPSDLNDPTGAEEMTEESMVYDVVEGVLQGAVLAELHLFMKVEVGGERPSLPSDILDVGLGAFGGAVGAFSVNRVMTWSAGKPSPAALIAAGIFTAFVTATAAIMGAYAMGEKFDHDTTTSNGVFTAVATSLEASSYLPTKVEGFMVDILANLIPH
jgi:RHS repeat-associated protein